MSRLYHIPILVNDDTNFRIKLLARRFERAGYADCTPEQFASDLMELLLERQDLLRQLLADLAQREEVFPNLT